MNITVQPNLIKEGSEPRPSGNGKFVWIENAKLPLSDGHGSDVSFEQYFNNAEKQCTGDEYYWQHQSQLQQSNLHFDPKAATPLEKRELVLDPEELPEKVLQNTTENPLTALEPHAAKEQPTTTNATINYKQLNLFLTEIKQNLKQLIDITIGNQQTITTKQAQPPIKTTSADYSLCFKEEFKTHHLFIQENKVELSLNTMTLNPQEKKILRLMIGSHLKEKGLILITLIINGVAHD